MSVDDTAKKLEGVVWKRRSGLGKLSETVGVGKSWERRRLILHAEKDPSKCKLCYYALEPPSAVDDEQPRGTLVLLPERATICAPHLNDTTQPTPYCLSIKVTDGISPEITKWKLCFDDRKSQMCWLVALTDAVVDLSIREFNAHTLSAEADKWEPGGFHRLYEEGEVGMFVAWRDILLGKDDVVSKCVEEKENEKKSLEDTAKITNDDIDDQNSASEPKTPAATAVIPPQPSTTGAATKSEPNGYYLPRDRFYQALAAVNISVVYAYMTAASTSILVVPWWQVLLAVNACIYLCLAPSSVTSNTHKETEEPLLNLTESMIGAELLREKTVPLSDVPIETTDEKRNEEKVEPLLERKGEEKVEPPSEQKGEEKIEPLSEQKGEEKVEPPSEEEMGAHIHERWAISAPDVDLTGSWTLVADAAFKVEYDAYLKQLGFNYITRGVACSLINRTTEDTKQSEGGRVLYLKGNNPKGSWERTLTSSGYPDFDTRREGADYKHTRNSIKTADDETVEAEAWWEDRGTVHRSWLRGGTKYGGGDFESRRYLGDGGKVLICESVFHPRNESKEKVAVTWRFQRI